MNKTPRKIILFDIDHTLFDASLYRKLMFNLITDYIEFEDRERLDKSLEEIYFSHREKIGYFDLEVMLEDLAKELDIDLNVAELFEAVLMDEASYEKAVFDETVEVLQELSQNKDFRIGIFSGGREEHQLKKIEKFKHFFHEEHIHILRMKDKDLPHIMKQYEHDTVVLIDDILQILYNAKKFHPNMTVIWMKRGRLADQQKIEEFEPDYTVTNLREILKIIV